MEKAKSKKKLIAIIAGAAMAFVLTVVVSVAATLAYFGQTATAGGATITMGQALEFDGAIASTIAGETELEGARPGQGANVVVSGKVKASTTKAYMLAKITIGGTLADVTTLPAVTTATVTINGTEHDCAISGDYLFVGTGTTCEELTFSDEAGTEFDITVEYTIPETLTNNAEYKTLTLAAEVSIIQSQYVGSTVTEVIAALANVEAAA